MAYTKQNFEDGQVLKAEHLNHMEDGIEQLSGEIADLSWDDLGEKMTEIMPETEVTGEENDGAYVVNLNGYSFSGNEETLIVAFDGVKYTCGIVGGEYGYKFFGNANMLGLDDAGANEPFLIDPLGVLIGSPILIISDGEPHTVKISGVSVYKLDKKYVDACTVFYVTRDDHYLYKDATCSEKVTYRDLYNAIKQPPLQIVSVVDGIVLALSSPLMASVMDGPTASCVFASNPSGKTEAYYTAEYTP